MAKCYRDLTTDELNFILLHSDCISRKVKEAFASCDGEEIIIVTSHRNPDDSNLTIYNIWDVKRSKEGDEFVFESKDEVYGKSALKNYLEKLKYVISMEFINPAECPECVSTTESAYLNVYKMCPKCMEKKRGG